MPVLRERLRGAGQRAPAVRLPPPAHLSAPGRLCREPQAAFPHLPRGTAHGAQTRRPQKSSGNTGRRCRCRSCRTTAGRWILSLISSSAAGAFASWPSIDDCTRECLAASPTPRCRAAGWRASSIVLIAVRGKPKTIVSDNGTELTSNAILVLDSRRQQSTGTTSSRANQCRMPSSRASMAGCATNF